MAQPISFNFQGEMIPTNPVEAAKLLRGKRIILRQNYDNETDQDIKKIIENTLKEHSNLLVTDNRPIKSFLWKAEKDGNRVFLVGDIHKTIQRATDTAGLNPLEDDLAPFFRTYFHPEVLQVFESAEKFYLEFFNFKHFTELQKLIPELQSKYITQSDPYTHLWYKAFTCHPVGFSCGLVDYLLTIKAGTTTKIEEIGLKLDSFVVEMEDISTQIESLDLALKLGSEGKIKQGLESLLESIDVVQMGDLNSLTTLYQELPNELKNNCEMRNQTFTNSILGSLEKGENALFAPGASHFIGERGILSLLEQQGVTVTRIHLD